MNPWPEGARPKLPQIRVAVDVGEPERWGAWVRWPLWRLTFGRRFRSPMSERLRHVAERDRWRCWLCGRRVPGVFAPNTDWSPSRDHVVPRAEGGTDRLTNLRLAHRRCNAERAEARERQDA